MDVDRYLIQDTIPISEAIKRIDEGRRKVVFCIRDGALTGTFTDGDMRRFILRDGDLSKSVSKAMNSRPISLPLVKKEEAVAFVQSNAMVALPIVNEQREVVDIVFRDDIDSARAMRTLPSDISLVIMAGGKGTRLYPYTQILPKALIPIGDAPIMDHIIKHFERYGVNTVYMVLNHKASMIKAYYNEGHCNSSIQYVDEDVFLGTGGGIGLLRGKINSTFFLSNCDSLLEADYPCMLDFHKENNNAITVIASNKNIQVPYGVIDIDQRGGIVNIKEKPEYSFLVNTGVYILEPFVIDMIKENEKIDMPDVLTRVEAAGYHVGAYPITEKSWLDMGQFAEMKNMIKELGLEDQY
ncbi:MAG: NTP transferase domain-containing protein [Lachnospiraceae bacterium]|nr:NTP transferase domain-containing protein [Lachnospiraceae bacterium]